MSELARLFVTVENNIFYSGSVILDSINNTMLTGYWLTSKQNNRPKSVVKVLFFSFKMTEELILSKRAWSVKRQNCYLKATNKNNTSSSVNNRAISIIDRASQNFESIDPCFCSVNDLHFNAHLCLLTPPRFIIMLRLNKGQSTVLVKVNSFKVKNKA